MMDLIIHIMRYIPVNILKNTFMLNITQSKEISYNQKNNYLIPMRKELLTYAWNIIAA